jgi:ABC-2 type transport system ATP-binding protein
MIEVQSLTRRYGNVAAVDNVSFTIGQREIVGLLGHNGAGKTTVMKMLSGYLEPSEGQILFEGRPLADSTRDLQRQLGYLPEHLPVYPEMSVVDYLDYAATLKGFDDRDRPDAVARVLDATDLGPRMLDTIGKLSRGYRQRVGVAQALLGTPRLLILDEPTNGLDPAQTEQMRALIRRLAEQATVILSTHIMQEVAALCDRVLVLNHGELVLDDTLASLRDSRSLVLRLAERPQELSAELGQVAGVAAVTVEADGAGSRTVIDLEHGDARDAVAAALSRLVAARGWTLLTLQPRDRDLDAVFLEATRRSGAVA